MNANLRFVVACTALVAIAGCAPPNGPTAAMSPAAPVTDTPSTPLADAETSNQTAIFIGSDRYYIAESKSVSEPEAQAKEASPPETNSVGEAPAKKPKTKPKGTSKPVDVEFVLSKSKDISVGLASDAPAGRMQNDDVPFVPASITKVFTAAAALRGLGPDFKFKTKIGFDLNSSGQASNLVIHSDGDPTMGMSMPDAAPATRMVDLVNAMKAKGIREIVGPITFVSADPRVDNAVYAQGISELDARECFGAMSTTFNFNSNCSEVRINAKSGFRWSGAGAGEFLTNKLDTVAGDRTSLSIVAAFSPDRILEGFTLRGSFIAKSPKTVVTKLPVANAVGWYGGELLKSLRENKIAVAKPVLNFARTPQERTNALSELSRFGLNVISIESPALSAITASMNKHSDNFLADSLFKAVGSRLGAPGSAGALLGQSSQERLRESLENWLSADGHRAWSNEFAFHDGAGLSADNRATPRAFLSVLRQLAKESIFPALWDSLPIAGVDGTLGDRMRQTAAAGKVRGKTGTLSGSYQLVGWIPKVRGNSTEYVPFVILTATTSRNKNVVRKFQDALVLKMYETLNSEK